VLFPFAKLMQPILFTDDNMKHMFNTFYILFPNIGKKQQQLHTVGAIPSSSSSLYFAFSILLGEKNGFAIRNVCIIHPSPLNECINKSILYFQFHSHIAKANIKQASKNTHVHLIRESDFFQLFFLQLFNPFHLAEE